MVARGVILTVISSFKSRKQRRKRGAKKENATGATRKFFKNGEKFHDSAFGSKWDLLLEKACIIIVALREFYQIVTFCGSKKMPHFLLQEKGNGRKRRERGKSSINFLFVAQLFLKLLFGRFPLKYSSRIPCIGFLAASLGK